MADKRMDKYISSYGTSNRDLWSETNVTVPEASHVDAALATLSIGLEASLRSN